jgi:hypothetical protein
MVISIQQVHTAINSEVDRRTGAGDTPTVRRIAA